MSKSAAGTARPGRGRNVRAKSGLNKAILNQGWFNSVASSNYKLAWNGGHLIAVPPKNTSRTCPCCGHISKIITNQDRFTCVECGFEENTDVIGAINVLRAGHAQLACDRVVQQTGQQQEPANDEAFTPNRRRNPHHFTARRMSILRDIEFMVIFTLLDDHKNRF